MKIISKHYIFLISSITAILFTSCNENENDANINFDKEGMLVNYAQNLIIPSLNDYANHTATLKESIMNFADSPTESGLSDCQESLKDAYKSWAQMNVFQFGPATDNSLLRSSNTFPTQFTVIENEIINGNWDLNSLFAFENKGLPAIEYLLHYEGETSVLEQFTSSENRRNYLTDLASNLDALAQETSTSWKADGGNYGATFVSNTGNDPSSGLSLLVNEFNKAYERSKNQRLGYPLGKNTLDGATSPKSLEAYYSDESLNYLEENVLAIEKIFKGGDGEGLEDYLVALYEADVIQEDLAEKILDQIALIKNDLNGVNGSLAEHVSNKSAETEKLYNDMQDLVVMIKSEMPSALSVAITYTDNDGD